MENVSHNTSFDSAEEDDLSRASNQQPFDQQEVAGAAIFRQQEESNRSDVADPYNDQMAEFAGVPRSQVVAEQQNQYGGGGAFSQHVLANGSGNPASANLNTNYWEGFQRSQQQLDGVGFQARQDPAKAPDSNQYASSSQAMTQKREDEEDASDQSLSRPTAVFGNQGGTANYSEVIHSANERESYGGTFNHQRGASHPQHHQQEWQQFEHNRIASQESRQSQQQQQPVYKDEFNQRFYPSNVLKDKLLGHNTNQGSSQQSRIIVNDNDQSPLEASLTNAQQQQQVDHAKKRSAKKSDFLQQSENVTVNNSFQSSKESILESLRNQSRQEKNQAQLQQQQLQQDSFNSERFASNQHSRAQSNCQNPQVRPTGVVSAHQALGQVYTRGASAVGNERRQSFPNSESEAAAPNNAHDSQLQGRILALLRIKLAQRIKVDQLSKRLAFEKLIMNRQNALMEQLLTDNESLLDQLQALQEEQQQSLPDAKNVKEKVDLGVHELYNDGVLNGTTQSAKRRNNSKTDQTSSHPFSNALDHPHNKFSVPSIQTQGVGGGFDHNSSNKESSPNLNIKPLDSAFMRAMIRDDVGAGCSGPAQNHSSPFPYRPVNNLENEMNAASQNNTNAAFFEEFSSALKNLVSSCQLEQLQTSSLSQIKSKVEDLSYRFDSKAEQLRSQCQRLDQAKDLLQTKVQGVDRLELENLELHMQLDAKLRALETLLRCGSDATKLFKFDHKRVADSQCQTETTYGDIMHKEASLQVFSKELSLVKLRQEDEHNAKVKELERRECDLEIRERLIEEKRIEYSYKQKELNQRIKSQMNWPLNCLENDSKLLEKFKDFKLKPDHLKTIEADSNLSTFLQREENLALLDGLEGDMLAKCEGLLHYEYLLLKERAKNMVFHENAISELAQLQAESEEVAHDRERYQLQAEFERSLQQESLRLEKTRTELNQIKENLFKLVTFLNDSLNGKLCNGQGHHHHHHHSELVSPQPKGLSPLLGNQLSLLLGNLQKSYSTSSQNGGGEGGSAELRLPPQINPYNQTINARDPSTLLQVVNDYRATDPMLNKLQTKDMQSLIESTIEHLESSSRIQGNSNSPEHLNQEVQNLRQIRRMLVRDAYFLQKERQWLDQERLKLNALMSRSHRRQQVDRRTAQVQTSSIERPSSQNIVREPETQLLQQSRVTQHGHKDSLGNTSNLTMENMSLTSQMEQDRKKISLLHQNLTLEKEYNRDLNTQLTAQMELIKLQNEKLIEGENQINEMKLRLLIKFEQIKVLEEYYNRNHAHAFDDQIHLDIELDDEQLRQIVLQLSAKYQRNPDESHRDASEDDTQLRQLWLGQPRKKYHELWALSGVSALLRHLLMDRCKFNPAQHRLQYALMLFKALTMVKSDDKVGNRLSGTGQLNALLQGSNSMNSSQMSDALDLVANHSDIIVKPMTQAVSCTAEVKHIQVATNSVSVQTDKEDLGVERSAYFAQTEAKVLSNAADTDWSELYWKKKRQQIFGPPNSNLSADQLRSVAMRLEEEVSSFWRFKAKNTLKLMQLHVVRRKRMLHAFAFQKFKVQAMRATVQRLVSARFDVNQVHILSSNNPSVPHSDNEQNSVLIDQRVVAADEMTTGKRHAIMLMLTLTNQRQRDLKAKNSALSRWKEATREAQTRTLQVEIGRLAHEVEAIKFKEEILRNSFSAQKNELEIKIATLFAMLQ